MQPRFPVQILPLETQVLLYGPGFFFMRQVPPYLIARFPDNIAPAVRHLLRRAVYVRMVIQHLIRFARRRPVHPRQRLVAPPVAVDIQAAASSQPALLCQPHSVP